jgi:hypothetical protein
MCAHAAQAADFMTTAEINRNSLNTDSFTKAGRFYADVTVKNVSASSQPITFWTNPGWSWVTDSNDVATSQEAAQNYPTRIMLKPDEVHNSRLEMTADRKGTGPTTFRLGFLPNADLPTMDAHDPALVWSNSITLEQIR